MSAFIPDKTHIDLLVSVAISGPQAAGGGPDYGWSTLRWHARDPRTIDPAQSTAGYHAQLYEISREARYETADQVGQMLVDEVVKSVSHLYRSGPLPGPAEEYWRLPYSFNDPHYVPTAIEALSALACYEYQACEHPDFRESEAQDFIHALRARLISALPDFLEAPWEWTPERLLQARARRVAA